MRKKLYVIAPIPTGLKNRSRNLRVRNECAHSFGRCIGQPLNQDLFERGVMTHLHSAA